MKLANRSLHGGAGALLLISFFGGDTINFDNVKPGTVPPWWTSTANRPSGVARWVVLLDATAPSRSNVFEKVEAPLPESDFPMAILDRVACRDGDLTVKFKIHQSPEKIKTAGLVWRFQDPRNYYLLQFSVDEKNIALFRVQDGQFRPIPVSGPRLNGSAVTHEVKTNQWYVARVVFRGPKMSVFFGNRQLFEAADDSLMNTGKTGLWTRGATGASFDDFRIDKKS